MSEEFKVIEAWPWIRVGEDNFVNMKHMEGVFYSSEQWMKISNTNGGTYTVDKEYEQDVKDYLNEGKQYYIKDDK